MSGLSMTVAAIAMIAAPLAAQTAPGEPVIATVEAAGWTFFGRHHRRERVVDAGAQGGNAIRVTGP